MTHNNFEEPSFERPHVVILGAGASLAAFRNGDKNGRKLPLMMNIIDVLGLDRLLDDAGINESRENFEKLYSDLVASGRHANLVSQLDQIIFDYFAGMELPDEPTLYDHLVLSLRSKDVIATFNWDPLLWKARDRNKQHATLPSPLFLHGNTAVAYCLNHKPIPVRSGGQACPKCSKPLQDCKLLYPVTQKNYNQDPFIAMNWELLM